MNKPNQTTELTLVSAADLGLTPKPRPLDLRVGLAIHWAMCKHDMAVSDICRKRLKGVVDGLAATLQRELGHVGLKLVWKDGSSTTMPDRPATTDHRVDERRLAELRKWLQTEESWAVARLHPSDLAFAIRLLDEERARVQHPPTETILSRHEIAILETLDEISSCTTGFVSSRAHLQYGGGDNRVRSGAVRQWLLGLMSRGLVRALEDQKPICWVRTREGTEALETACAKT